MRDLILPTALTVTTFAIVLACGGDDEPKKQSSSALSNCADESLSACVRCKDSSGKAKCGPSGDCYADTSGNCHTGSSS
jgi:hypothetical protein